MFFISHTQICQTRTKQRVRKSLPIKKTRSTAGQSSVTSATRSNAPATGSAKRPLINRPGECESSISILIILTNFDFSLFSNQCISSIGYRVRLKDTRNWLNGLIPRITFNHLIRDVTQQIRGEQEMDVLRYGFSYEKKSLIYAFTCSFVFEFSICLVVRFDSR